MMGFGRTRTSPEPIISDEKAMGSSATEGKKRSSFLPALGFFGGMKSLNVHRRPSNGRPHGPSHSHHKEGIFGYPGARKGEILVSMIKGSHGRNRHSTGLSDSSFDRSSSSGSIERKSSSPQLPDIGSNNGRISRLMAQAEADAVHKGYLETRRHRMLGKSWIRVYCILTNDGTFHIFQHVPSSHHVIELEDFHCIDNNAKKMQVFSITPIVESPQDRHAGTNHYIFRCPPPDGKKTKDEWLVAVRKVKHQLHKEKLQSPTSKGGENVERRHSLPKDFGSSNRLPVLSDIGEEDEELWEDKELCSTSGPTEDIAA